MGFISKYIEELTGTITEFISLKTDDLKLTLTKALSIVFGKLLSLLLVLFVFFVVLLAIAFGLALLLGQLIGSYAAGAFIMAGIFLIVTIVLFLMKDKLFVNNFVKLFTRIFFE